MLELATLEYPVGCAAYQPIDVPVAGLNLLLEPCCMQLLKVHVACMSRSLAHKRDIESATVTHGKHHSVRGCPLCVQGVKRAAQCV